MEQNVKTKVLLIVECSSNLNWYEIWGNDTIVNGFKIQVEQAEWDDISIIRHFLFAKKISYDNYSVLLTIRGSAKAHKGTSQERTRSLAVDFVLLRSVTRGIKNQDSRNKLFALMHGNIPSVNSLESAYYCLERCIVFGELRKIAQRLGTDKFPVINQTLFTHHREMLITPEFPIVGKVGHAHAGYGKIRLKGEDEFADFRSLCALHGDYVTVEPFIDWDWDGRIQKIGSHYRVFKRVSGCWKGNTGNMSLIEDIDMTPEFKVWIDESSKIFGGLDICGLDFLHSKADGKYYILEMNDTAIGLVHKYEKEDMGYMRDVVVLRMQQVWGEKSEKKEKKKGKGKGKKKEKETKSEKSDELAKLQEEIELLKIEVAREKEAKERLLKSVEEAKGKKKGFFF